MFVVQETGDTFRIFRQAEASGGKREAGGERETHATGKSAQKIITRRARALRPVRAGLRSPQKREKKTTPILQATRTEEQIKVVYLLCKEIA